MSNIALDRTVAANGAVLRGRVYDIYRSHGYFPIMLKSTQPIRVSGQPIWLSEIGELPSFVLHHPRLVMWPRVVLILDSAFGGFRFCVHEWMPESWCQAQAEYVWEGQSSRIMIGKQMIADDPMRLANLVS